MASTIFDLAAVNLAARLGAAVVALTLGGAAFAQDPPAQVEQAAQGTAPAGDAQRGARLAHTCYGCHGVPNYRNAYPTYHVPRLGGQHPEYVVLALQGYRDGTRPHPTMHSQAATMSDQDMADVAAYIVGPEPPLQSQGRVVGTPPEAAQVCVACHGQDGVGILPEYPTLSGQYRDYLEHALRAYRSGARQNAIMQGFAAPLSDADIRALADYFSRQRPPLWVPTPRGMQGGR